MPMKDWAKLPVATEQSSVDQKLYFALAGSLRTKGKLPITFGCAIIRMHNSKGSLCFLYKI